MTLKEAIVTAFQTLEAIVPNYPQGELETRAMKAWLMVLESEKVTPDELETAVVAYLKRSKPYMPTPGVILELVCQENKYAVIRDPVTTQVSEIGVVTVGSESLLREKLRELDALPELTQEDLERKAEIETALAAGQETPALPGPPTTELREKALESLEHKALKRMPKPARTRSEFDNSPDPEAEDRKRRNLEELRRQA